MCQHTYEKNPMTAFCAYLATFSNALKKTFMHKSLFLFILSCLCLQGHAQIMHVPDSIPVFKKVTPVRPDTVRQVDLIDVLHKIIHSKKDTDKRAKPKKLNFSIIPSVGYTLSTGFAADVAGNVAFYTTANHAENLSEIEGDLAYDTNAQRIFVIQSVLWSLNNDYKFVSDLRWERFPESTYGLGTKTGKSKENPIDFKYLKVYGTLYRRLVSNYYAGIGYNLDYHYAIVQSGMKDKLPTDLTKYGPAKAETSSGLNFALLYDSRKNPINPSQATYANISYRENNRFLGSRQNWRSLQFDFRKYIKLSAASDNVLAIWSLAWFTNGYVPYLDLPFTGGDVFNNTGRGYIEGRFRGKNMLYLESEYRFGITRNGLIGGVVFANAQSFSEFPGNRFNTIAPAIGTGLRLKLNKHSRTNVCIDYGIGIYGSRGLFVNLGEVF